MPWTAECTIGNAAAITAWTYLAAWLTQAPGTIVRCVQQMVGPALLPSGFIGAHCMVVHAARILLQNAGALSRFATHSQEPHHPYANVYSLGMLVL